MRYLFIFLFICVSWLPERVVTIYAGHQSTKYTKAVNFVKIHKLGYEILLTKIDYVHTHIHTTEYIISHTAGSW